METISSFLGSALLQCCKCLCTPAWSSIKTVTKFNSNLDTLKKEMDKLLTTKTGVVKETLAALADRRMKRSPECERWLAKFREIEASVSMFQRKVAENQVRLHGCGMNWALRFRLSKQVVEKLRDVKQMFDQNFPDRLVIVDLELKPVEEIPGPFIIKQNKASENLKEVMDQLKKDEVRVVGVSGMAGVGKTTLVHNLNKELKSNAQQPFGLVIFVVVSKDADTRRIQHRLAERLYMEISPYETTERLAFRIHDTLMRQQKFLLILDDVWEEIKMYEVGIPRRDEHSEYKVVLTTRFLDVCTRMGADRELSVIPLSTDEAWELFCETVGAEVVNSEKVRPFAEDVAKECAGLPLAIITVAGAMKKKTEVYSWDSALRALQSPSKGALSIKGVEKKVFGSLMFSYESLEGKEIRDCFLYCSLYPEDYRIPVRELIQCWRAEGYLDDCGDHEDAWNDGLEMITRLKDSCLLEFEEMDFEVTVNCFVRMHDVIRDFAIWLAFSNAGDGDKPLIRSGLSLTEITEVDNWGSYKRISYMQNKIAMLPYCVRQTSQVSSLLLSRNYPIENMSIGFLQRFKALRVLNLSYTSIRALPEMGHLGELRALLLKGCRGFKEFPSLRGLGRLQVLDLSDTPVQMLPNEERCLQDLRLLKHLVEFYVWFTHLPNFTSEDIVWLRKLRRSTIGNVGKDDNYSTAVGERHVHIQELESWTEPVSILLRHATDIFFQHNTISELWRGLNDNGQDFLKSLSVARENPFRQGKKSSEKSMAVIGKKHGAWTKSTYKNEDVVDDRQALFPSLESLSLYSVTSHYVLNFMSQFGRNLRILVVFACDLNEPFPFSLLQKLEEITVSYCFRMVEIIKEDECSASTDAFPNLRRIKLSGLPQLESISKRVMSWPRLQEIQVELCPALKKLPFSSRHASTIQVIKGEKDWWDQLQWSDDDTKSNLYKCFQPIDFADLSPRSAIRKNGQMMKPSRFSTSVFSQRSDGFYNREEYF